MNARIVFPLLLVASLSACVSQSTYKQEVQQVDTLSVQNKAYAQLTQQLQTEIQADQVKIKQLEGRLTVTLVDEIVFSSGSAEMNMKGRATIDKIVGTLQNAAGKRIVVEGYTDNTPIGPGLRSRYPTNWELSTARACDVVRYLQAAGIDPVRLEAAGFGEYQPVAANDTPAGRSQNRRIDIVLMDMGLKSVAASPPPIIWARRSVLGHRRQSSGLITCTAFSSQRRHLGRARQCTSCSGCDRDSYWRCSARVAAENAAS